MSYSSSKVTEVSGYRLSEMIGAGGMGEVYKAYNSNLNRFAAVKILHQATLSDRFKNEAYIQSSVNHPNIARLYEFTSCGDKQCILMELVEGEPLDSLSKRKGKLSSLETENIIVQVASALEYLHKKDIIHRDIKPQNFKIQQDGCVKMLDFGIAKNKYSPKFTQAGFIVGTLEYLAPEQFRQASEVKSDVWALAILAYELITGYMPFEDINPVQLQAKINRGVYTNPKLLVPGISEKLAIFIEKGLKVNAASRISAGEIVKLLKAKEAFKPAFTFNEPVNTEKLYKYLLPVSLSLILIIIAFIFYNSGNTNPADPGKKLPGKEAIITPPANENVNASSHIIINVPGINDAEIVLQNGEHHTLPYTINGKEGDLLNGTIHAEGFVDKDVQVVLTPRRLSYEFNLEKK